jgi:hypothetical protein
MTTSQEEGVRMSFNVPIELYQKFKATLPWGIRSHFIRAILELSLSRISEGGDAVLGAIIHGDFDPLQKAMTCPHCGKEID